MEFALENDTVILGEMRFFKKFMEFSIFFESFHFFMQRKTVVSENSKGESLSKGKLYCETMGGKKQRFQLVNVWVSSK